MTTVKIKDCDCCGDPMHATGGALCYHCLKHNCDLKDSDDPSCEYEKYLKSPTPPEKVEQKPIQLERTYIDVKPDQPPINLFCPHCGEIHTELEGRLTGVDNVMFVGYQCKRCYNHFYIDPLVYQVKRINTHEVIKEFYSGGRL